MIPATCVPALCGITTSMIEKSESELTAAIEAQKKKMSKKKKSTRPIRSPTTITSACSTAVIYLFFSHIFIYLLNAKSIIYLFIYFIDLYIQCTVIFFLSWISMIIDKLDLRPCKIRTKLLGQDIENKHYYE